jgi:hypothetical protein
MSFGFTAKEGHTGYTMLAAKPFANKTHPVKYLSENSNNQKLHQPANG